MGGRVDDGQRRVTRRRDDVGGRRRGVVLRHARREAPRTTAGRRASAPAWPARCRPRRPWSACTGSTPSEPRPWRISVARVARSAMFSRPKPHSCVLAVDTPTALAVPLHAGTSPWSRRSAGKAAGDSDDEVGVKRRRNAWFVSLKELVNGAGPAIVAARPPSPPSTPAWPGRTRPSSTAGSRWTPARSSRAGRSGPARLPSWCSNGTAACPARARAGCTSTATMRPTARAGR